MSGYQDPYSGFFGEPGAWNWSVLLFMGWAGLLALIVLAIFIGYDNGGFLHRFDRKLKIRNVDREEINDYDEE